MKNLAKIALGIVSSIGGFLDVGSIATSAQAGAKFGYQLLWAIALATLSVIVLVEMAGRLAASSGHTIAGAIRERLGFKMYLAPFTAEVLLEVMVLAAEIGGICIALELFTGIEARRWGVIAAFGLWLLIWMVSYEHIERATSLLGLITLCFIVAAFQLHPPAVPLLKGFLPHSPGHDSAEFWFLSVSIIGAVTTPYVLYFYSSGAIEDQWTREDLKVNRAVAVIGMSFGSIVSMAILIVAARTLLPQGITIGRYEEAALILTRPFGIWGYYLFAGSLLIACLGAALEVSLNLGYVICQNVGWNWGKSAPAVDNARYTLIYSLGIFVGGIVITFGVDPLKLTLFTMSIATLLVPFVVVPMLVLLNDEEYVGAHRNGRVMNWLVVMVMLLSFVTAAVAIPLQLKGGS